MKPRHCLPKTPTPSRRSGLSVGCWRWLFLQAQANGLPWRDKTNVCVVPSRHFRHDYPRLIGFRDYLALDLIAPPAPTANPGANINAAASLRSVNYMVNHICRTDPIKTGYIFRIRSNAARWGQSTLV